MTSPVAGNRAIAVVFMLAAAAVAQLTPAIYAQDANAEISASAPAEPPANELVVQSPSTPAAAGTQGEVTANDVYVRSGDSTNHYTVCKLNAGNRVTILSERGEWYEIAPPPGTFSLISGDYVDTADGRTGIVNGDNVRVRAGSLLNENKYTVQAALQKGTTVNILGRNPDGFLRIEPPQGATLWINKSYVRPADGGALPASPAASSGAQPSNTQLADAAPRSQANSPGGGVLGSPVGSDKSTSPRPAPSAAMNPKWRTLLDEADKQAREESAKDAGQRNFAAIVTKYEEVAGQGDDEYARQYAASRLEEIRTISDLAAAVDKVNKLHGDAEAKRREFMEGRATMPALTEPVPRGAQVQGELRISALYPPGSAIVRYRLVDPLADKDRTIAYVEIPPGSPIKIEGYVGRYVGVIAYEKRLHTASVDPVPIYIANELMLLESPSRSAQK